MARDLVADLGGKEALSAQKLALLDEAVLTKLILASLNMWIVKQRTLVHRQKVLPVVMQRNSLAISLKMMLETLGLDRQARPLPALADYLALPREAAAPQVGGNDGSAARSAAPAQDGDSGTPSAGDALPGVRATPGDQ